MSISKLLFHVLAEVSQEKLKIRDLLIFHYYLKYICKLFMMQIPQVVFDSFSYIYL